MATNKKNTGKNSLSAGAAAFVSWGNPAEFLDMLLTDKRAIADYILQTNGVLKADIEQMKKEPRKAVNFRYLDFDGEIYEGDYEISYSELLRYIGRIKKDLKNPKKQKPAPAYPLSLSIIKGLTGAPGKGHIECKDENKLKKAAYFKLEHIFLSLLHETSEKNPKHKDFFKGNIGPEPVEMKVGNECITGTAARAEVDLKEIYKRWNGGRKLGATDKKFIAKTINEYRQLNFVWQFRVEDEHGKKILGEYSAPRVQVVIYTIKDAAAEEPGDLITDANAKILLTFHPVFLATDKYANTRYNLAETLEMAAGGGGKVLPSHWLLYHYLNSLRSTIKPENGVIKNETGFISLLKKTGLDQYLNNRNKSKAADKIRAVISDIQNTGLLINYNERPGPDGPVFCFYIAQKSERLLE